MSWSYSPGLVEAFLEVNCLDTQQSAQWNTTLTPDQYYWPDKLTEHSRISRFGMTCEPLTGNRGGELLTWFLAGFLAKTSALQDEATDWTESVVDSGGRWRESLARYDPDTHSLRTAQLSLVEDWTGYSLTLPRSGLMLDGQCWELPMLGRITREIEYGFWPTPNAMLATSDLNFQVSGDGREKPNKLGWAVAKAMWPTPTVCGNYNRKGASATSGDGLATAVKMWPTPTAHNAKETNAPSEAQRNTPTLAAQAGGQLNPSWVEQLMGWPIGHTDLKPLETDKSHNVVQPHGGFCHNNLC